MFRTSRILEQLKAFLVGRNVELEYQALAPGLRRLHPLLPGHARHAGRFARAHPRHRATAQRLSNELDAIRFDAEHDPDPT